MRIMGKEKWMRMMGRKKRVEQEQAGQEHMNEKDAATEMRVYQRRRFGKQGEQQQVKTIKVYQRRRFSKQGEQPVEMIEKGAEAEEEP